MVLRDGEPAIWYMGRQGQAGWDQVMYRGPEIYLWSTNVNLLHKGGHVAVSHQKAPVLGTLLILCSCLAAALQYIIQVIFATTINKAKKKKNL